VPAEARARLERGGQPIDELAAIVGDDDRTPQLRELNVRTVAIRGTADMLVRACGGARHHQGDPGRAAGGDPGAWATTFPAARGRGSSIDADRAGTEVVGTR
jgi:hypothetical protein